jgi:hypothetical protein
MGNTVLISPDIEIWLHRIILRRKVLRIDNRNYLRHRI